jgi:hypothetical protein
MQIHECRLEFRAGLLFTSLFVLFKSTDNLANSSDTSNFIGKQIKAKFVHYKVSFISKTGLVVFELLIKNFRFQV